jgi:hypothetical protein
MMFRIVFWDVLPCKIIVDNHFTRQYIPEDNSEHQDWDRFLSKHFSFTVVVIIPEILPHLSLYMRQTILATTQHAMETSVLSWDFTA